MIYRALLMDQDSIPKPLVHYNFEEYTNDNHPAQIPDLMGSGYNLNYNNISFNLMSGFGGYLLDFPTFLANMSVNDHTSRVSLDTVGSRWLYGKRIADGDSYIPSHIVKVTGVPNETTLYYHRVVEGNTIDIMSLSQDGIYLLPESLQATGEVTGGTYVGVYAILREGTGEPFTITVEQLPLYPGCAVFGETAKTGLRCPDNMAQHFSVGKGFTVICQRYVENIERTFYTYYSGDTQANRVFQEYSNTVNNSEVTLYSFGKASYADLKMAGIVPYTSTMYDGAGIQKGDTLNVMQICLGVAESFRGGMKEFYLFNRDLTQSQIERFISENMVLDPLVYYDVRKQNTKNIDEHSRGTLIDLSGNGNHGTLNNFNYTEDSGWVETYIDDEYSISLNGSNKGDTTYANHQILLSNPLSGWVAMANVIEVDSEIKGFRIKVTGMPQGDNITVRNGDNVTMVNITKDGVYEIPPHSEKANNYAFVIAVSSNATGTIEFLPQTDYIQFDGVDDSVTIPTLTQGFKTVCILGESNNGGDQNNNRFFDQRSGAGNYFALYDDSFTAYNTLSTGGETFINGLLNTSLTGEDLRGKNISIVHRNNGVSAENSVSPVIGVRVEDPYNSSFRLSKFLGFREYLSDTQIKKVIEKYGLMEGTDKIDMTDPLEGIHYVADWDAKGRYNNDGGGTQWIDKVNGKVIDLYNFAFAGMSGWNGYGSTWNAYGDTAEQVNSNTVKIGSTRLEGVYLSSISKGESLTVRYRITGLPSGSTLKLYTNTKNSEGTVVPKFIREIEKDGTYTDTITWDSENAADDTTESKIFLVGRDASYPGDMAVLAEQLPLYPGALVFDGVDDRMQAEEALGEVGTVLIHWKDIGLENGHYIYNTDFDRDPGRLYCYRTSDRKKIEAGIPAMTMTDEPIMVFTREPANSTVPLNNIAGGNNCPIFRLIFIREKLNDTQVEFLKQKVEREYREWCEENGYDYAINQLIE